MDRAVDDLDTLLGEPEVPPAYDPTNDRERVEPLPDEGPLSTLHLLTHLPKHPDCKVCQEAKAQRRPGRRVKRGP
eukprot:9627713-Prorocentrum_lima.AAC.1